MVGLGTGTIYSAKFVTKWVFSSCFWGWGPGKLCWQIRCSYIFTFFYTIGDGPSLTSVPRSKGFDSISFQKDQFFFVIAWNMLSSLLAHHPTHLPTLPSFPKIYEKCWNEIHNCRECLTNMATCHSTTAPCIFLLCDIFIHP